MGALVWLLIPAVAAVFAAVWARWAARKRVTHDGASLAGYERFRAAMESVPDTSGRPSEAAAEPAGAEAVSDARDAAQDAARPAAAHSAGARPAPAEPAGRRRRVILAGHGPGGAHSRRKATAQAGAGAGEEDSPKGPVAGSVP